MAQTLGTNITVDRSPESRELSLALDKFIRKLGILGSKTHKSADPACRVFRKAGIPVTNTEADSPGGDLCFVIDTTNNDLYFISGWTAAATFTATLILN